jgi:hypothetical protein
MERHQAAGSRHDDGGSPSISPPPHDPAACARRGQEAGDASDTLPTCVGRPRAFSEAVGYATTTPTTAAHPPESARGRFVASWLSWKGAWDAKRSAESAAAARAGGAGEERHASVAPGADQRKRFRDRQRSLVVSADAALLTPSDGGAGPGKASPSPDDLGGDGGASDSRAGQPRKFSLLLRRKSSRLTAAQVAKPGPDGEPGAGLDGEKKPARRGSPKRKGFRRVQSQLHPPVSNASGGEGRRYLEYAAELELDDESFERLVEFTKQLVFERRLGASNPSGTRPQLTATDELAARDPASRDAANDTVQIRLEDYADASSEDLDFLDDEGDADLAEAGGRVGSRGFRTDGQKLTLTGNEEEFAAFFADFGLDDVMFEGDAPAPDVTYFDVEPAVLAEWEDAALDHNESCGAWVDVFANALDIRCFADSFSAGEDAHRRRR